MTLIVHSPKQNPHRSQPVQSHLKTDKSGRRCAPLWSVLAEKLEALFPDGDDTGSSIESVHRFSASRIAETAWGKPAFKLALLGNGQVFAITALDLHVPGIPKGVLQQVISQASTAKV